MVPLFSKVHLRFSSDGQLPSFLSFFQVVGFFSIRATVDEEGITEEALLESIVHFYLFTFFSCIPSYTTVSFSTLDNEKKKVTKSHLNSVFY